MKSKKWLLGLVTFAAMAVLCVVCAGAETYGDFEYSVLDDGTVAITKYIGSAEKVDIPSKIDGKSVTKIEDYCADLGNSITKVIIPNSVIIIKENAFLYCYDLSVIVIESGNENYSSLDGVLFDKNKTKLIYYPLGKKDKNYIMPDGVKNISDWAFSNATFTSITMSDSLIEIGDYAFYRASLISVKIPDSVKTIGSGAFFHCKSLADISIPDSVTSIGEDAFKETELYDNYSSENGAIVYYIDINGWAVGVKDDYISKYTSLLTIQEGTKHIAEYSFKEFGINTQLTVNLPDSMISIGKGAFLNCYTLISVSIPASVQRIDDYAFGYEDYDNEYTKIDDFKIYCYPGTAGEQYAKDNGFDYELIKVEKPANVTGFKVKSIFSTNVTLQWNKNTSASGYEIEQYKGGKWVNVAKITGNATTSYTVKGLAAGTAGYKFRMRAVKNGTYSDYTSALSVNTNPYGVGGFKCSSKTSTSVTLKWNKGTTASGYELQQYKDGKWVTIYTGTKATDTSYTVKKLKAGTAGYRFRIRAYKTYGNTKQYGSWSSEVKVNTNPYGVGGFKCSSKSSTSVTLKWNKGTTASGYQLQQYKNGKWVTIYTGTKATNTSYTVKNLKAGTAGYRFRIRAYKTYGNTKQYGSWSSEVKVNTNPYGVGGFKAKSTAKNSITLGWNKGTTASGYELQQYKNGKWVTITTPNKPTTVSYTVKSLKANTSYKFRIRAYKTYGNTKQYGSWSKELTVKTKR